MKRIKNIADQFNLLLNSDSVYLYSEFQHVYREIEKSYTHLFETVELRESRFEILIFLFYSKEEQLSPSEIANKLGVTRPTASKLLKRMTKPRSNTS